MKKKFLKVILILACALFALSSCDRISEAVGERLGKHKCDFGKWETVREATCTEVGIKKRECDCGEDEIKEIAPRGHELNSTGEYCLVCGEIMVESPTETETETDTETETESGGYEIGDPGYYSYSECNETVYVNSPGSAITLRSERYEAMGSVPHGTELKRIGLSTDEVNYWSKVIYEEKEYYVATRFLTTMQNPDEGFVEVSKVVVVNDWTGSLNIRNLPSYDGQIIGWAEAGVETKVVAENATTGWYKIEFTPYGSTEKTYGYIKSDSDYFVQ